MRMGAYTTNPTSTEDGEFVFGYDYMSRRVSKQVPSWDAALNDGEGDWNPTLVLDQRYVYDGWNVVLVLDGLNDNAVVRKYCWGLDLSGRSGDASPSGIHGAGGIGGLLAAVETSGTHAGSYWYLYDANGNVGQVLNATDPQSITLAAHYEYDPYGNTVAKSGTYADYNPFRFSTKWLDDETGLYYYGYRYYDPRFGRWISRDPIGEAGGLNLQGFAGNKPTMAYDPVGLSAGAVTGCHFGDGIPRIFYWMPMGPCTKACTTVHEAVHWMQQVDCCLRAVKAARWVPMPDVQRIYTNWLDSNDDLFECMAYRAGNACAAAALRSNCCPDAGQLEEVHEVGVAEEQKHCAAMKPYQECPFPPVEDHIFKPPPSN